MLKTPSVLKQQLDVDCMVGYNHKNGIFPEHKDNSHLRLATLQFWWDVAVDTAVPIFRVSQMTEGATCLCGVWPLSWVWLYICSTSCTPLKWPINYIHSFYRPDMVWVLLNHAWMLILWQERGGRWESQLTYMSTCNYNCRIHVTWSALWSWVSAVQRSERRWGLAILVLHGISICDGAYVIITYSLCMWPWQVV